MQPFPRGPARVQGAVGVVPRNLRAVPHRFAGRAHLARRFAARGSIRLLRVRATAAAIAAWRSGVEQVLLLLARLPVVVALQTSRVDPRKSRGTFGTGAQAAEVARERDRRSDGSREGAEDLDPVRGFQAACRRAVDEKPSRRNRVVGVDYAALLRLRARRRREICRVEPAVALELVARLHQRVHDARGVSCSEGIQVCEGVAASRGGARLPLARQESASRERIGGVDLRNEHVGVVEAAVGGVDCCGHRVRGARGSGNSTAASRAAEEP